MNELFNCVLCDDPVIREDELRGEVSVIEEGLRLNLETRTNGDGVTVVLCSGRIVYRDEAFALSQTISKLMRNGRNLILDLSGVEMMDGAGLGEFVGLYNRAVTNRSSFKLAALRNHVRSLFELTNLAPVFEIYRTVEEAAVSYQL